MRKAFICVLIIAVCISFGACAAPVAEEMSVQPTEAMVVEETQQIYEYIFDQDKISIYFVRDVHDEFHLSFSHYNPKMIDSVKMYIDDELVAQENEVDEFRFDYFTLDIDAFSQEPKNLRIELVDISGEVVDVSGLDRFMVYDASDSDVELSIYKTAQSLLVYHLDRDFSNEELACFQNISYLCLPNCNPIKTLNSIASLENIRELALMEAGLSDISALSQMMDLKDLVLYAENSLDLSVLGELKNLAKLRLFVPGLNDLQMLEGLDDLAYLDVSFSDVNDLSAIADTTGLKRLNAAYCNGIDDISFLSGMNKLERLYLDNNAMVEDISTLAELVSLKELSLNGLMNISDISALAGLTNLQKLDISWCSSIEDLAPLLGIGDLRWLDISYCDGLTSIGSLEGLSQIEYINKP